MTLLGNSAVFAPCVSLLRGLDLSQPQSNPPGSDRGGIRSETSDATTRRWLLPLSLVVGAVWWAVLLGLAAQTANPVTLNIRQLSQADVVVLGRVVEHDAGRVQVLQQWLGPATLPRMLVLDHLDETIVEQGKTYLFPLSQNAEGTFGVTRGRSPATSRNAGPQRSAAYVYPASPKTIQRLESMLKRPRQDPPG
jgi:hypothetical protein